MELPDLMELQQFRQDEGLMAPQYRGSAWRVDNLVGLRPKKEPTGEQIDALPNSSGKEQQPGGDLSGGVSVEDSSFVADRLWRIRAVMDLNDLCGTWGVGGAQRVGAKPGDGVTTVDHYRISVPTRLQLGWGKFILGDVQREEGSESLALSYHLLKTSRTGGGRGSAHYEWIHSPRFDTKSPDETPGRWEEASEAIKLAQAAAGDQYLLSKTPPLPKRQEWTPPGGWGIPPCGLRQSFSASDRQRAQPDGGSTSVQQASPEE